ncbi:hypothetical protein GCM10009552_04830 [Rothia nasimurium]
MGVARIEDPVEAIQAQFAVEAAVTDEILGLDTARGAGQRHGKRGTPTHQRPPCVAFTVAITPRLHDRKKTPKVAREELAEALGPFIFSVSAADSEWMMTARLS